MDFNNFMSLDPNPFVLTSVVPYYHMKLVIPSVKQANRTKYYTLPFRIEVWILHLLSIFYFSGILKITFPETHFRNNLMKVVQIILTGSVGNMGLMCFRKKCILLAIIFYSIVMSLTYMSYLGSFFTSCIDKTDFLFMCSDTRIELLDIQDENIKFLSMDTSDYFAHALSLNMSYGYCLSSIFWYKNFGFQKNSKFIFKPIFSKDNAYGHYIRINKNSKYLKEFNDYLLLMYSTGFMTKWGNDMHIKNYTRMVQPFLKYEEKIMRFKDLEQPLMVFGICVVISAFIFAGEISLRLRF